MDSVYLMMSNMRAVSGDGNRIGNTGLLNAKRLLQAPKQEWLLDLIGPGYVFHSGAILPVVHAGVLAIGLDVIARQPVGCGTDILRGPIEDCSPQLG